MGDLCSLEVWKGICYKVSRKKEFVYKEESELKRVLNVFDLTFLGVGSMLGMGVYIMVGILASKVGPAMVLSFIIAGFASALSALCYAEFAGRTPGTGSAYAYCYTTVGELLAFILGWDICLEFIIGTACLARGLSGYFDSLFDGAIGHYFNSTMHMDAPLLTQYPDFLAFFLMVIFTTIICMGAKESTTINNVFVSINGLMIVVVVVVGILHINPENWSLPPSPGGGVGGFMPYGFSSVMAGAAKCFYAYCGFDSVATTGGEAKNPKKTIPIALLLSIGIAILVYTLISTSFTLMWPYTDQMLMDNPPYPYVFNKLNLNGINFLVIIGATAAVTGCLLSCTFAMTRIFYSMANDGLIFKPLAKVNTRTRTPVRAALLSGLLPGVMAVLFSTDQLIEMTAIGTLMGYTMVAVCVLILRYEDKEMESISTNVDKSNTSYSLKNRIFNFPRVSFTPTQSTSKIVKISLYLLALVCLGFCSILAFGIDELMNHEPFVLVIAIILAISLVLLTIIIGRQPQSQLQLSFKVKPVPLLPIVCMIVNIYLMLKLTYVTWIRFFAWLILGFLMYFGYGIWNSKEGQKTNR